PSGPTYSPVAGLYSATAIGGASGAGAGADTGSAAGAGSGSPAPGAAGSRGAGMLCPDSVAFGSPFQLYPSLSGTYSSSPTRGVAGAAHIERCVLRHPAVHLSLDTSADSRS